MAPEREHLKSKPDLDPTSDTNPLFPHENPTSSRLTLTQLYQSLNTDDAKKLFEKPTELKDLFEKNAKYIDSTGTGHLHKSELAAVMQDPTATAETKQLASGLLLGYETIENMGQSSNPVGRIPFLKFLSNGDIELGISTKKLDNFSAAVETPLANTQSNEAGITNAMVVIGLTAGALLLRKVPGELVTEVGKVVFSSFGGVGAKSATIEKAFAEVPTWTQVAKEFSVTTAPKILAGSLAAYIGTRAYGVYDHWTEHKKVEKLMQSLEPTYKFEKPIERFENPSDKTPDSLTSMIVDPKKLKHEVVGP